MRDGLNYSYIHYYFGVRGLKLYLAFAVFATTNVSRYGRLFLYLKLPFPILRLLARHAVLAKSKSMSTSYRF